MCETINGSLGHGLGVAGGMALGLKRSGRTESVFVVTGDGELHEGANWEAIMFASQHRLDNLHLIVDNNTISMLGFTDDIVVRVTASGSGSRVDVRSSSHLGRSDFGVNAACIRAYLAALHTAVAKQG